MRAKWDAIDTRVVREISQLRKILGRPIRMLDIGCGRGEIASDLRPFLKEYVGTDASDRMLPASHVQGVRFIRVEAEKLPASLKGFDLVLFKESLDHCYHGAQALKNAYRALRKGGRVIVTLNNRSSYYKVLFKAAAQKAQAGASDHFEFYDLPSLMQALRSAGFEIVSGGSFNFLKLPVFLERALGILPDMVLGWKLWSVDALGHFLMPLGGGSIQVTGIKR